MATLLVDVENQEQLEKLLTFIKDNSLKFEICSNKLIEYKEDYDKLYTPSNHFKEYLGNEWLTKSGMISKNSVLYYIDNNIKLRGIRVVNGIVFADEWLQKLLEDTRGSFHLTELSQMINKLII